MFGNWPHAIISFLSGMAESPGTAKGTNAEDQAHDLLVLAANLEDGDRARALALYGEVIRRFPDTRASEEARRNLQILVTHEDKDAA